MGWGQATLKLQNKDLKIKRAFHAPSLSYSLIPLLLYVQQGYSLLPTPQGFKCCKEGHKLFSGSIVENLLVIHQRTERALTTLPNSVQLHQALGHPSQPYLEAAHPTLTPEKVECTSCDLAKMHRQPFPGTFPRATTKLKVIHMDLCGPITPTSRGGNKYFLKIVDGYSKYRFLFTMERKSQTFELVQQFLKLAETQSGECVKFVVSNNGGEFISKTLEELFKNKGIAHLRSAPYTPQQNPFAERGNRITIEKARAMLIDCGLPLIWWGEASYPLQ